jgi:hypothetical protein
MQDMDSNGQDGELLPGQAAEVAPSPISDLHGFQSCRQRIPCFCRHLPNCGFQREVHDVIQVGTRTQWLLFTSAKCWPIVSLKLVADNH